MRLAILIVPAVRLTPNAEVPSVSCWLLVGSTVRVPASKGAAFSSGVDTSTRVRVMAMVAEPESTPARFIAISPAALKVSVEDIVKVGTVPAGLELSALVQLSRVPSPPLEFVAWFAFPVKFATVAVRWLMPTSPTLATVACTPVKLVLSPASLLTGLTTAPSKLMPDAEKPTAPVVSSDPSIALNDAPEPTNTAAFVTLMSSSEALVAAPPATAGSVTLTVLLSRLNPP